MGFVRGVNDCCTFAAGWASAAMGRTLACAWLGKPLSDEEALAILEEAGGLEAAVDQVLLPAGWQHVSQPNAAPEYAIALLASAGGFGEHTLGIVRATWVVTREEPRGAFPSMLRTMPKSAILQAWEWPH